jgi:rSAM/selenodomain-associated transferase 2
MKSVIAARSNERITVVIPALNEEACLPCLLGQLVAEGGLVKRIVVSDGGSTDETVVRAREAGAVLVSGPSGRGGQIARGISAASGAWLLLLHADSILPLNWPEQLRRTLAAADPARAYYGRLRFLTNDPRARVAEALVWLRCFLFRLPYGDQGLLIHRSLIDAIGGVPELPLMEDVALARRLGRRLAPMALVVETDASAYLREGWLRRSGRNLWRLLRFLAGAEPNHLMVDYRR